LIEKITLIKTRVICVAGECLIVRDIVVVIIIIHKDRGRAFSGPIHLMAKIIPIFDCCILNRERSEVEVLRDGL
jgi:hypothetical protein